MTGAPGDYHNHADYMLKLIARSRTRESDRPQSLASSRINSTVRGIGGEGRAASGMQKKPSSECYLAAPPRDATGRSPDVSSVDLRSSLVETRQGSGRREGDENTRCRMPRCACEKTRIGFLFTPGEEDL